MPATSWAARYTLRKAAVPAKNLTLPPRIPCQSVLPETRGLAGMQKPARWQKGALQLPAPLEGAGECHFVRIFQFPAHRHAVGDARHLDAHRLDEARDVGRRGLALDIRVRGQHDLLDPAPGKAREQFADAYVVRPTPSMGEMTPWSTW